MRLDNGLLTNQVYDAYKPLLFSLAYRMLGSVMDAEDISHEAFIALNASDPAAIRNVKAYLCRIVTNRCLDTLKSARHRREVYVGPWLPEPLLTEKDGPYQALARHESLSTAYLLLLQQLSAVERAVFLLREALGYEYDEIAEIVGKSAANCRQIFHRARRGLAEHRPSSEESGASASTMNDQLARLIGQFVQALSTGDTGLLLSTLSADAAAYSDGGGKVHAALRPILGRDRVAIFIAGVYAKQSAGSTYRQAVVGGEPGIVTYADGKPVTVLTFRAEQGRIADIYIVINPEKLTRVQ
ncbi:RNA polymerase sigma-70 factor [Cohnella nanjingensis]|uniref:RNA polymerase sigma-70 factor n=1 Tax=Cohnella nanjingensis TaxID=1387779 RepID=A0A7X0RRJ2_9BACL|nr:RNA polymerase sigma-70 factor [Cohnella nanjingensis]MBB6671206.1 RNA polymerase sigma-70 factor [Cohnella nanjingensis]